MSKSLLNKKPCGKLVIAILDRGWVFLGRATEDDATLTLENAFCIRIWGTTDGIGQLALEGAQKETKLDRAGTVAVPKSSVIALIECAEASWPNY